jgi:hypothetical protein
MKAERARRIAAEWAAEVRLGHDPGGRRNDARKAPTMSELFDRFLSDHSKPKKKVSSIAEDERLIRLFLRPAFGSRKVSEVTRAEVDRVHRCQSAFKRDP